MTKLYIFTGSSGVGKGSMLKKFFAMPGVSEKIGYSISSTTRKPRKGEIDGIHYNFVSRNNFLDSIKENEFLEWAEFAGNLYGTNKKSVEDCLNSGKNVLLEIELEGARKIKNLSQESKSIFVLPPSMKVLESRLRSRFTESQESIKMRLEAAVTELNSRNEFDYQIVNDYLDEAVLELNEIIFGKQARC